MNEDKIKDAMYKAFALVILGIIAIGFIAFGISEVVK